MALIIYPDTGWDSFVSVADADTIIGGFTSDGGYSALDAAGKEAILKQTALQIRLCPNIVLPDAVESDLELAQCYLTTHALTTDMLSFDSADRAVTKEKVGEIEVAYDSSYKATDNSGFPTLVYQLLSRYGCRNTASGFSQGTLFRG